MSFLSTSIFPNGCPVEIDYPPDTIFGANFYPFGLSLGAAMAIAWRGMTYRMVGDAVFSPYSDSVDSTQIYRSGTPASRPDKMSDLLCAGGENNFFIFRFGPFASNWVFSYIIDGSTNGKVYKYNGLYYPYIQMGFGSVFSTSFRPSEIYPVVGKAIIEVDGEEFSADLVGSADSGNIRLTIEVERGAD